MDAKILARDLVFSFKGLKNDLVDFVRFIKNNKLTTILCWFFLIFSYGVKWIFYNISADTEIMLNDYHGMSFSWVGIDRFGLVLTKKIFRLCPFNPFVANFLMLCTMFLLLMFLCFIFSSLSEKFNNKAKCLFILPCVFITHPLFAEQFNYTLQGFEVSFAILLSFLAAYLITKWIFDSKNLVHLMLGVTFLVWAFWSYQAVLFLYISLVLALYVYTFFNFLTSSDESIGRKFNKTFFRLAAFKYILTFVASYAVYFIVNKIVKIILHAGTAAYLDGMIEWGQKPLFESIKNILNHILGYRFFCICGFILFLLALTLLGTKNKNKLLFLLSLLGLLGSPFLLAFYLGHPSVPRSQFSLQVVLAFSLFFLTNFFEKKALLKSVAVIVSMFLAFTQGYRIANVFYTEYMRYNYDVFVANKIEERINQLDIEDQHSKPIVFVNFLKSPVVAKEMKCNNIGVSFFEWYNPNDPNMPLGVTYVARGFMQTIGCNYKLPTSEECKKALEISKTMKVWPSPCSVKYEDGIIIVKLPEEFSR